MITTNRNNTWWLRRLPVVKKLKKDLLRFKTTFSLSQLSVSPSFLNIQKKRFPVSYSQRMTYSHTMTKKTWPSLHIIWRAKSPRFASKNDMCIMIWYTIGCFIVLKQVSNETNSVKNTKRVNSSLNFPLLRSTVKWFFGTRLSLEAITGSQHWKPSSLDSPVKRNCNAFALWSLTSSVFTHWGRCRSRPVPSHHLFPGVLVVWLWGIFQTKSPCKNKTIAWL